MDAVREARRKRILQASESRMSRVLGTVKHEEPQALDSVKQTEIPTVPALSGDHQTRDGSQSAFRQRLPIADKQLKQTDLPKSTVKISPLERSIPQSLNQTSTDISHNDSLQSSHSSAEAKMILKHFEFLRIILCVMVAYLCRRVLATGYGIFYFQTSVLPFACLEAAFFVFKSKVLYNVTLHHKSSMLIGLLMLCGIKPAILQTYTKIMGYVTAATEDFAIFFFAFMMANVFIL